MVNVRQKGFTLIELIVVIVVLGILAVFAVPKYLNFTKDAARASVEGLGGAIQAAGDLYYGKAVIANLEKDASVPFQGITLVYGYPSAGTLIDAIAFDSDKYTSQFDTDTVIIAAPGYTPTETDLSSACQVTYEEAAGEEQRPVVTYQLEGCDKDGQTFALPV